MQAGPSQQVNPTSQSLSTQLNFGQMYREVGQWNPDLDSLISGRFVNNAYRSVIDRRLWNGLLRRGQVTVPQVYTTGTVTTVTGSQTVTGIGTAFTSAMVNRQFRCGFSTGWYNIQAVDVGAQTLTLDLPWGPRSFTQAGYQIVQAWVTLGFNVKFVKEMVNTQQGYRIYTNLPQKALNLYDTWRVSQGWTYVLSPLQTMQDGSPLFELYPAPTSQQNFPFLAYVQPSDMSLDADFPASFVRSDILVGRAVADALLFRGKNNKYYDPQTAQFKISQFEAEVQQMMRNDDNQGPQDMDWNYSEFPFSQMGSTWNQSHAGEWYA
jgi:hypothetical protein